MFKELCKFIGGSPSHSVTCYHPVKFGCLKHSDGGDMFLFCYVISQDHVTHDRLYRWEPLKVSHQPAKFGGHRHFSTGDILVYHVISQDHVIKGSCDSGEQPGKVIYHIAMFGGYRHFVNGDIMNLVCHMIFLDQVIKGLVT